MMIEDDTDQLEREALTKLNKANRRITRFITGATLVVGIILIIMVSFGLKQIFKTGNLLQEQNQGLIDYLACVGKLPLKAEARTPDKIQGCVDLYTNHIKNAGK